MEWGIYYCQLHDEANYCARIRFSDCFNITIYDFDREMEFIDHLIRYQLSGVITNQSFAYAKQKPQISCAVTAQVIGALIFASSSVAAQAGLCHSWSEIPKTGFLASRLI